MGSLGTAQAANFAWEIDYQNSLRVRSVQRTSDGGIILGGYGYVPPGLTSMNVIKLNAQGQVEWVRAIGGNDTDYGETVLQLPDGSYIISGNTWSWGNGATMLARLNPDGSLNWFRVLGPNASGESWDMVLLPDGVVVAGQQEGQASAFAAKVDLDGNLVWMKTYSYSSELELFYGATVASDGNPVLAGLVERGPFGGDDIWVMKVNSSDGTPIWCKIIGTAGSEKVVSLVCDASGNLLLGGSTNYTQLHGWDFLTFKLTSSGDLVWINRVGRSDNMGESLLYSQTATLTQDNGMVILGRGTLGSDTVIMLVRIGSDGSLIWSRGIETLNDIIGGGGVISESNGDFLLAVDKVPPASTILLAGFPYNGLNCDSYEVPMVVTPWNNYGVQDFTPITRDFTNISAETPHIQSFTPTIDTLCETLDQNESYAQRDIKAIPLPGAVMIETSRSQDISVDVYDPAGRMVAQVFSGVLKAGQHIYCLPDNIGAGLYMVMIQTNNTRKLVKTLKP